MLKLAPVTGPALQPNVVTGPAASLQPSADLGVLSATALNTAVIPDQAPSLDQVLGTHPETFFDRELLTTNLPDGREVIARIGVSEVHAIAAEFRLQEEEVGTALGLKQAARGIEGGIQQAVDSLDQALHNEASDAVRRTMEQNGAQGPFSMLPEPAATLRIAELIAAASSSNALRIAA